MPVDVPRFQSCLASCAALLSLMPVCLVLIVGLSLYLDCLVPAAFLDVFCCLAVSWASSKTLLLISRAVLIFFFA